MTIEDGVDRFPALLIGIGGTGVRTLRYIRWLAETGGDTNLERLHRMGGLQLVAIDTDWKANEEGVMVSEYVLPRRKGWESTDEGDLSRRLPQIDQWISVKTEDIVRAYDTLRKSQTRAGDAGARDAGDEDEAPARDNAALMAPTVPDWLFDIDRDALSEMSLGQARYEGAGQWRLLGRIGLFTRAPDIFFELEQAHKRVKDACGPDRAVRVYIICSVAGGTGSGMFWDVAFMMRLINPECMLTGSFLLAGAFRGSDRADRIDPNTYAVLKELAAYKNWNLRSGEALKVKYPIGHQGVDFEGRSGADTVFNLVYVYQGFGTTNENKDAADIQSAGIELSCYRIAQNVVTQLRIDLRAALDEGANNDRGDVNAPLSQPERGFVFSTSTMVDLGMGDPFHVALALRARLVNRFARWTGGEGRPPLSRRDLQNWLMGEAVPGGPPTLTGLDYCQSLAQSGPKADESLITLWLNHAAKNAAARPRALEGMRARLDDFKGRAKELAALRHQPDQCLELLKSLYHDYVDEKLREGWRARILDPNWGIGDDPVRKKVVSERPSADELYADDLLADWKLTEQRLESLARHLEDTLTTLDADAVEWLRKNESDIQAISERARYDSLPTIRIEAPASLIQMRAELGLLQDGARDAVHAEALRDCGPGPVDRVVERFCTILRDTLDLLLNSQDVIAKWPAIVRMVLKTRQTDFHKPIQTVLTAHHKTERRLARCRDLALRHGDQEIGPVFRALEAGAEDFERLMEPLARIARDVLRADKESLNQVLSEISELVETTARDSRPDLFERVQATATRRTQWHDFLRDMVHHLEKQERLVRSGSKAQPMVEVLARLMEERWLCPAGFRQMIQGDADKNEGETDEKRLELHLGLAHLYAESFVRFWAEQTEFMMARLGGTEKNLADIMAKCRSKVFGRGSVRPTIQQNRLVIGLPKVRVTLSRLQGARGRDYLLSRLRLAAQRAMNVAPSTTKTESSHPFVYYEEVYRAGAEILEAQRYHRSYRKFGLRLRKLLHIDRGGSDLPDLVDDDVSPGWELCGNPGCSQDIRNVARTILSCPGCQKPILNRCGNAACSAAHLLQRLPALLSMKKGQPDPLYCPECGGELRTRWWRCPEVAHASRWISSETNDCPQCQREYKNGQRPLPNIRRFHSRLPIECPGCVTLQVPSKERQLIPPDLHRYFHDGVSRSEQAVFKELVAREGLKGHRCKNPAGHLLFPTLRLVEGKVSRLVPLHRDGDGFVSEDEETVVPWSCYHCGFPTAPAQIDRIGRGQEEACARCQRALRLCPYCSVRGHTVFQAMAGTRIERCPRCTNVLDKNEHGLPLEESAAAETGLGAPSYCRNLFGCRAGRLPWGTAAEYHVDVCQACAHPEWGPSARLLHRTELPHHVDRCPVCLTLLGPPPDGGRWERLSPARLLEHFITKAFKPAYLQRNCVVCGTSPTVILDWMVKTDYFDDNGRTRIDKEHIQQLAAWVQGNDGPSPEFPAADGLDVLANLMHADDAEALYPVSKSHLFGSLHHDPVDIQRQFERLFAPGSLSDIVVRNKLKRVVILHEEDRAREKAHRGDVISGL